MFRSTVAPTIISAVTVNGVVTGCVKFCPAVHLDGRRCTTLGKFYAADATSPISQTAAWVSVEKNSTASMTAANVNAVQPSGMVTMPAVAFQTMVEHFTNKVNHETRTRYIDKANYESQLGDAKRDLQDLKKVNKDLVAKDIQQARRLRDSKDRIKRLEAGMNDMNYESEDS
uniref:Uncharacterized protein n=1 Tax=Mycena chlorophos TaxID=658473 RepID=A0ABQ0LEN1_MYCCL|nr:predicted protein [Mycena chlorophos]